MKERTVINSTTTVLYGLSWRLIDVGGDVSSVASLGGWLIMEERTSDVHPISLSPLLLGTGGGDVSSVASLGG